MCEKSHVGGDTGAAPRPIAAAPGGPPRAGVGAALDAFAAGGAGGPALAARCAAPPTRPPDKLKNPSTFVLKKSVHTRRLDVAPPCEWPTSQNALMFWRPNCSITELTMFCRYWSSSAVQTRRGENGVATTKRYFFT